ncbi:MAG: exo-alpha-sialidase [Pirellulales bacterium]|nr:exo-alpha-sialidase [Pirellulales bacterium]
MRHWVSCLVGLVALSFSLVSAVADEPRYSESFVFPFSEEHNHAPGVVECPNGDLLVSWYRGAGERSADNVAVYGARQRKGSGEWSEAFLMVDTPGFPDCNTTMMIDSQQRLWLFWPVILANTWESCLTKYLVSQDYEGDGVPKWQWQDIIPLKPQNFEERMTTGLDALEKQYPNAGPREKQFVAFVRKTLKEKLSNRLGWQPRCKPTVLPSGRILLPLYTDTYSVSLMAISDDQGKSWYASEPLVSYGGIQPAVLRRNDGTLVAYMRENGPLEKIRVCESKDDGITWGPCGTIDLPNPGAGIDAVRLANGHWVLIYNDTTEHRNSLALAISEDEGKTWPIKRHLEKHESGSYHYPAIIQGADGTIHAVYSYFRQEKGKPEGKTMKHAAFNEAWIREGDKS